VARSSRFSVQQRENFVCQVLTLWLAHYKSPRCAERRPTLPLTSVSGVQTPRKYRKLIARQLRTQYVEGIYRHNCSVTLKSRLRVTQGHCKRNHWRVHIRLSSSRIIWRWILLWPWNVGYRSLKVIESGAIRKLGCGFLSAFHSNYGRICSRLWDIQHQRMAWPRKQG